MERVPQKTAVFQPGAPVLSEGALGKVPTAVPWVGGGNKINQTTLRSYTGKGFSQTPAQMQKTQARALYIILSKSDHVQVLQCTQHLSFTHLSLLQCFALHEHPGIRGGGKRREPYTEISMLWEV